MAIFLERIGFSKIIKNHWNTFYNFQTGKTSWIEIILIILVSLILSTICTYLKCINQDFLGYVLTSISILSGFLISAIFVLTEKRKDVNGNDYQILQETVYNLSFGVLLGIIIIIVSGLFIIITPNNYAIKQLFSLYPKLKPYILILKNIIAFSYFFLLCIFFHTIFMILQRINKIFE